MKRIHNQMVWPAGRNLLRPSKRSVGGFIVVRAVALALAVALFPQV